MSLALIATDVKKIFIFSRFSHCNDFNLRFQPCTKVLSINCDTVPTAPSPLLVYLFTSCRERVMPQQRRSRPRHRFSINNCVLSLGELLRHHMATIGLTLAVAAIIFAIARSDPFEHAENSSSSFFPNFFNPDSLMGAGPHTRGPPKPTNHGFSDQSSYVHLSSSGALVAVADFNRDRFLDLLMIDSRSLRAFSVMLWDHDEFAFRYAEPPIFLDDPIVKQVESAAGVNPLGKSTTVFVADFSHDGALDVLVSDGEQGRIFFGDGAGGFNSSAPVIIPELPAVAALVDADADFVPDIFVSFSNGTRGFWQYQSYNASEPASPTNQSGHVIFRPWPDGDTHSAGGQSCTTKPEMAPSIAFADINGDCLPDLVIPSTCGVEVWTNQGTSSRPFWSLSAARTSKDLRQLGIEVFNFDHGDRVLTVADFNSDGTLDFAVVNVNRQDMLIHLNKQKTRAVNDLCSPDDNWEFERRVGVASRVNLRSARLGPMFGAVDVPRLLHVGDYDMDGMADLLAIDGASTRPVIYRNKGIWAENRMQDAHFERLDEKVEGDLSKPNGDAISATFFDTDESGRQDILVVRAGNDTRLMWNSLHEGWDVLFFKGTILSGLNYRSDPKPFAPVVGSTVKLGYTERGSRHRIRRTCSQCAQSGSLQLSPCNCQYGLQGIANYIEELWAGAGASTRSWSSLMPNSMAIIWSVSENLAGPWKMEYFTQRRGSQMLRVTAILMIGLMTLGSIILWLQYREAKEDRELNERESARLFNFVV